MQTNTQVNVAADEYPGVYADDGVYGTVEHDVDKHADVHEHIDGQEERMHLKMSWWI